MGTVSIQEINKIGTGNGYGMVGPYTGVLDDDYLTLQDVGSLEGSSTETVVRENFQIKDGQPSLLVKEEVIAEAAKIESVYKEKNLTMLCRQLGKATTDLSVAVEATVSPVGEKHTLYDQSWGHLRWKNVKSSPAPTVESQDPTPTPYVENTDFKIDYEHGMIRRISGGSIPNPGDISIDYSATKGRTTQLNVGGQMSVQKSVASFIYEQSDGGRQITTYPGAYPGPETQQIYNGGGANTRPVSWEAAADMTLDEGSRLRIQSFEEAV